MRLIAPAVLALAPATLLLALGACASTGDNVAPPPAGFDTSATQFEGWARVEEGEIRLYAAERDLDNPIPVRCVSGALPRNAQRSAAELNGSKIRLVGRVARWADRGAGETYDWQGSDIVNRCGRDVVILADRVEVLR